MYFSSTPIFAAAAALLFTSTSAAPLETRATTDDGYGLSIGGGRFDINSLQTFRLSYANSSAYIGQIKYQTYSEPLVVQGAGVNGASDGLSFLSIHSSPTGFQEMYVVPHQSQPLGFSVPHGGSPTGVRTTGFSFGADGNLHNNGLNLFYACQDSSLASISSWQVYWLAKGTPSGFSCRGPLAIKQSDGCARF